VGGPGGDVVDINPHARLLQETVRSQRAPDKCSNMRDASEQRHPGIRWHAFRDYGGHLARLCPDRKHQNLDVRRQV